MNPVRSEEIANFATKLGLESIEVYSGKEVDRKLSLPLIKPSTVVCDIGGRIGVDAIPFAALSSCSILVDLNSASLKRAKSAASKVKLDQKMAFVAGSATDLPFRDEVFDVTTSFSVLDHVPNKHSHRQAIKEMSRTTRDFGYVVVTVPNKFFVIKPFFRRIAQLMGNPFVEKHFTPKEIRKAMILAQLTPVIFDSNYPTKLSPALLTGRLPVTVFPKHFFSSFLRICEIVLSYLNNSSFKSLGLRMGYVGQKTL